MCVFGVIKLKFNFKPLFIPQNQNRPILAQNGTSFKPKSVNDRELGYNVKNIGLSDFVVSEDMTGI